MKYLLDTNIFIWATTEDINRVPDEVKSILKSSSNEIFLSSISIYEIGQKLYLSKKLKLPEGFFEDIVRIANRARFKELPLNSEHTYRAALLNPEHKDPFDRFLVAQAVCEGLILITPDEKIRSLHNDASVFLWR